MPKQNLKSKIRKVKIKIFQKFLLDTSIFGFVFFLIFQPILGLAISSYWILPSPNSNSLNQNSPSQNSSNQNSYWNLSSSNTSSSNTPSSTSSSSWSSTLSSQSSSSSQNSYWNLPSQSTSSFSTSSSQPPSYWNLSSQCSSCQTSSTSSSCWNLSSQCTSCQTTTCQPSYWEPPLSVSCQAYPNPAQVNQIVTFLVQASGGTGSYSYSWSGACIGNSQTCQRSFSGAGSYSVTVTVTSGCQTKSATCSVTVEAPPPPPPSCQDECSPAGAKRCACSTQYQVCGNYDSDPCLEWSPIQNCPPGTICQNGECISQPPSCQNECSYSSQKERRCNGNIVEERDCGNYDSDPCLEWSSWYRVEDCGTSGFSNEYRCSSSRYLQRKWIERGCSSSSCFAREEWRTTEDCGTDSWTDNYRCFGNILQREKIKKGCLNNSCFEQRVWENWEDCASQGKICLNNQCISQLKVSCQAYPNPAKVNEMVTFLAQASGGTGSYSYSWSGACIGNSQSCQRSFSAPGNYLAKVSVQSDSQSATAECEVKVEPLPSLIPGLSILKTGRNLSRQESTFSKSISASPGEEIEFKIVVTSTGSDTARNVVLKDILDKKLIYLDELKIDGQVTSQNILNGISLGDIEAGKTKTVTFKAKTALAEEFSYGTTVLTNIAEVKADQVPTLQDSASVIVLKPSPPPQSPGLSVIKKAKNLALDQDFAKSISAKPQDSILFLIEVESIGSATAKNVILKDILDNRLEYLDKVRVDNIPVSGNILEGISLGDLPPKSKKVVLFEAKVTKEEAFSFGTTILTNTVKVSSEGLPDIYDSVSISVYRPSPIPGIASLGISKLLRPVDPQEWSKSLEVNPGQRVEVLIEVSSLGSEKAKNVIVKDILPPKTRIIPGSLNVDGREFSGDIVQGISLGDMGPQEKKQITFQIEIAPKEEFGIGQSVLVNEARAKGENTSEVSDSAQIIVIRKEIAGVSKVVTFVPTGGNIYLTSLVWSFLLSLGIYFATERREEMPSSLLSLIDLLHELNAKYKAKKELLKKIYLIKLRRAIELLYEKEKNFKRELSPLERYSWLKNEIQKIKDHYQRELILALREI